MCDLQEYEIISLSDAFIIRIWFIYEMFAVYKYVLGIKGCCKEHVK
jgi:hypothetical protein